MNILTQSDQEQLSIKRVVDSLYHHVLQEYTARANSRAMIEELFKFFDNADIAVISKNEYKELLAIKDTVLSIDLLKIKGDK